MATLAAVEEMEVLLRNAPLPFIAARIRRARKIGGLTHDRMGELCGGMTRQQLIKLEQGRNRPRLRTLERIAEGTDRDVRWFLDPEVDPSPFPDDAAVNGDR